MIQQYFSIFLQPFFHLLDSACCFFISYIKLPFLIKKKTTEATVASYIKFIYRIYLSSKLSYTTFKKQKPFIKKKRDFQKQRFSETYPTWSIPYANWKEIRHLCLLNLLLWYKKKGSVL